MAREICWSLMEAIKSVCPSTHTCIMHSSHQCQHISEAAEITGAQILSCFSAVPFSNIQKVISLLVLEAEGGTVRNEGLMWRQLQCLRNFILYSVTSDTVQLQLVRSILHCGIEWKKQITHKWLWTVTVNKGTNQLLAFSLRCAKRRWRTLKEG